MEKILRSKTATDAARMRQFVTCAYVSAANLPSV
jgi:hypothetical protein